MKYVIIKKRVFTGGNRNITPFYLELNMKDIDFTECSFIKKELCFLDYIEFCKNAKALKVMYKQLTKNGKIFYKWYCYSNIHMTEFFKNIIWEYLNNDEPIAYVKLIENIPKYKFK